MNNFDDIWENGIISFDTCSLGRMYEWESKYSVNIKDALSYLMTIGKLWETQINVEEFSIQRKCIKETIYDQKYVKGIFNNLKKSPIPWLKINRTLGRWEAKGFSNQFINEMQKMQGKKKITDDEYAVIEELSKISSIDIDFENLFDQILKTDTLTLSEKDKTDIHLRYNSGEICPGAMDFKKRNGNKYNDLYIWELLKKKAKTDQTDIIFVTADTAKGDWFIDEQPRPEYLHEFQAQTGQKILILSLTDFWENCKKHLDISIEHFLEISTIKEQIQKKYDDSYQPEICSEIENLLFDSNEIKVILEDIVDCCVDMPTLNELVETTIDSIEIEEYDNENVYVTVYLQTEANFEARNHTCGEDWSAGNGSILLYVSVSAEIPVSWTSEDTDRIVLDDEIILNDIFEIEVLSHDTYDEYSYDESYDSEIF